MIARLTTPFFAAELDNDGVWQSAEEVWRDLLRLRFDPRSDEFSSGAMGPAGVTAAKAAAEYFSAELEWGDVNSLSGTKESDGVIF